ncbi:FAD-binding oxidoreductase [Phanerochaete sordida]|uniref:FAD-binding oxidoreductase n=1 Tax=Phanerochaete sordida TaxID=48140 RepID=A0A9P3L779_9APHY|nr:FAD-binding oxidoreductase [Phanerochaete sordida]
MPSTVILGTGIIGLSTAYYLSQLADADADTTPTAGNPQPGASAPHGGARAPKHEIHLVEPSPELFASASGKAAGFLAKDWFAPAVAPLGALSFDLHRALAAEHGGAARWGFAESVSYSLDREDGDDDTSESAPSDAGDDDPADEPPREPRPRHRALNDLDWLMSGSSRATLLGASEAAAAAAHADEADEGPDAPPEVDEEEDYPRWVRAKPSTMQAISDRDTTGQVDPYRLCQFLLQECVARGVKLHHPARATQLVEEPAEAGAAPKTSVRLQFLGPDPESAMAAAGTPNSKSPPSASPHGDAEGSPTDEEGGEHASGDQGRTVDLPCDSLIITAGCWTPRVYRTLFPNAGRIPWVTALAGHSISVKSRKWMRPKTKKSRPPTTTADGAGEERLAARPVDQLRKGDSDNSVDSVSTTGSMTLGRASPTPSFSRTSSTISTPPTSPDSSLASLPARPSGHAPLPDVCHAVFTSDRAGYSPEIFSRLSGDVWLGGLNSAAIPLPALPTLATPDPAAVQTLLNTAEALLGHLAPADPSAAAPKTATARGHAPTLTLLRSALCFRPVTPTGRPVIARMHEADLGDGVKVPGGVFVATGHGPWGISLSLGTGRVVSEMVLGRTPSVDVSVLGKWEAGAP